MSSLIYRQSGRDDYYKIWHTQEQNMFILIQAGIGSVVSSDNIHPMQKGTLCFIGKRKYHYTFPDIPKDAWHPFFIQKIFLFYLSLLNFK